jgi:hypothetical protein
MLMIEPPSADGVRPNNRAGVVTFAAATVAVVVVELGRRWVIPPPLILVGAFVWLILFGVAFARRWQRGLSLVTTLPVGLLLAFAIHLSYRHYRGFPLLS